MTSIALSSLPVETISEAAWRLAHEIDPFDALWAAVFSDAVAVFSDEPEVVDGTCKHGHPWTAENTWLDRHGWRRCRTCNREYKRRHYARRK